MKKLNILSAKANCESAELDMIQALWAILWSLGKEVKDYHKNKTG